jgi:hypothetical protein
MAVFGFWLLQIMRTTFDTHLGGPGCFYCEVFDIITQVQFVDSRRS